MGRIKTKVPIIPLTKPKIAMDDDICSGSSNPSGSNSIVDFTDIFNKPNYIITIMVLILWYKQVKTIPGLHHEIEIEK